MDAIEQQLVSQSLHKANALKTVLESEFAALKEQDLSQFEKLQTQKLEILAFLSQQDFIEQIKTYASDKQSTASQLALWDEIIGLMDSARNCIGAMKFLLIASLNLYDPL